MKIYLIKNIVPLSTANAKTTAEKKSRFFSMKEMRILWLKSEE